MKFLEVNSALPGMRVWVAAPQFHRGEEYHFVITCEDGSRLRKEDRTEWTGYTATWKSYKGRESPAVRIDGLWQTLEEAERACAAEWERLKAKS